MTTLKRSHAQAFFGSTRAMLALPALFVAVGFLIGYGAGDFTWFARCGALVVASGITLLSRASIIREDIRAHFTQSRTGLSCLDPEHYVRIGKPIPEWVREDIRTRAAVGVWGPLVTFVGTMISGFGDLLNRL